MAYFVIYPRAFEIVLLTKKPFRHNFYVCLIKHFNMKKDNTQTGNKIKQTGSKNDKASGKKTITKEHKAGTDEYGSGLNPKRNDYRSKEHDKE